MDHYYRRAEGFGVLILLQDLMKTDACRCGGGEPPQLLSMRACIVKSDEEKSKHAGLAQENGFIAHAQVLSLCWLRLVKRRSKPVWIC